MDSKLTDTQRRAFATRALSEPVANVAAEAGVQPSTVYDWMKKFSVSVPDSTAPHESLAGLSLAEDARAGSSDYMGVEGALPPDRSRVSYWRAENWAMSQSGVPVVDIVAFADGRHGLVMPQVSSSPRRTLDGTLAGLGTFAGVGSSPHDADMVQSFADTPHPSEDEAGRVTWWRAAHTLIQQEWQLRWMIARMQGDDFSAMDIEDRNEVPSVEDMWDAARAYHEETGHFALPVFGDTTRQAQQFRLGDPEHPGRPSGLPPGVERPVGFAILSAQQASELITSSWEHAYRNLSETMAIFNDWRDGSPVEAIVMVFSDDPNQEPVDLPTGYYPTEHLAAVSKVFLAETGAGYFA